MVVDLSGRGRRRAVVINHRERDGFTAFTKARLRPYTSPASTPRSRGRLQHGLGPCRLSSGRPKALCGTSGSRDNPPISSPRIPTIMSGRAANLGAESRDRFFFGLPSPRANLQDVYVRHRPTAFAEGDRLWIIHSVITMDRFFRQARCAPNVEVKVPYIDHAALPVAMILRTVNPYHHSIFLKACVQTRITDQYKVHLAIVARRLANGHCDITPVLRAVALSSLDVAFPPITAPFGTTARLISITFTSPSPATFLCTIRGPPPPPPPDGAVAA